MDNGQKLFVSGYANDGTESDRTNHSPEKNGLIGYSTPVPESVSPQPVPCVGHQSGSVGSQISPSQNSAGQGLNTDEQAPLLSGAPSYAAEETEQPSMLVPSINNYKSAPINWNPSFTTANSAQMPPIQGVCVPGIGNPVPGRHSRQSFNESPNTSSRPTNEISTSGSAGGRRCLEKFCNAIICVICVIAVVLVVLVFCFAFQVVQVPLLDLTETQIILNNDTILLSLPQAYTTPHYWYNKLVINITKPTGSVQLVFVSDDRLCTPNDMETVPPFYSAVIQLRPNTFVNVIVEKYLTPGSILHLSFTVIDSTMLTTDRGTITFCILDHRDDYEQFKENNGDPNACKDHDNLTYLVSNNATYSLNYTFLDSQYFFMIFLSTKDLHVQYSYNLTYYYYKLKNYKSFPNCTIEKKKKWQPCLFGNGGTQGCFLAHAAPSVVGPPLFTNMTITLFYNRFFLLLSVNVT